MPAVRAPDLPRADGLSHPVARVDEAGATDAGQVLHPFSQALRERFPECIAGTRSAELPPVGLEQTLGRPTRPRDDVMVKGIDGKLRRFPADNGTVILLRNGWPDGSMLALGRTFLQQRRMLYDAHKDAIAESISEYVVDSETQRLVYKAGDTPIRSLRSDLDVFSLPGAKWMVPQTEFRGCTYACETMLLLEGKSAAEATATMRNFSGSDSRRNVSQVAAALCNASRRLSKVLSHHLTSDTWVALLKENLARYGPGILNIDGHARVLDAIDTTRKGHVFTMRDPFTGSFLRIRDHEAFWSPSSTMAMHQGDTVQATDRQVLRQVSAVFLTQTDVPG